MRLTYYLPSFAVLSLLTSLTPAIAQSISGSATVSSNLALNATGILFNAAGTNTAANPLTPGSPNTGSFAGLSSGTIQNLPGVLVPGPLSIKNFATFTTSAGTVGSMCRASRLVSDPARSA